MQSPSPSVLPRLAAAFFIAILFSVGISQARILRVPTQYRLIQLAIENAEDRDSVLISPGNYTENLSIENKGIFIIGNRSKPDNVVIDGSNGGDNGSVVMSHVDDNSPCGATIAGVTLCNGTGTVSHRGRRGGAIFSYDDWNRRLKVEDCIIRDNQAFEGAAYYSGYAIPVFKRTSFINNAAEEYSIIMVLYSGIPDEEPFLNYCLFQGNSCGAYLISSLNNGVYSAEIENCSFIDNYCPVALILAGASRTSISNCIAWDNSSNVILGGGDDVRCLVTASYSDIRGGVFALQQGVVAGEGILNTNPLFLDPDNGDYSLSPDSPCIDTGDPDSPLDPDGTRTDMGAFYFHQRDIEVDRFEVVFNPTGWEEIDSQFVEFSNVGLTDLHLTELNPALMSSFIFHRQHWSPDEPITIQPDSTFRWWIYFHPRREGEGQANAVMSWEIISDDPDEDSILVSATGEILGVESDKRDSFPTRSEVSAFPNPFNSMTTIRYSTDPINREATSLRVYGIDGRLATDLTPAQNPPSIEGGRGGLQKVVWNAEGLPGGIYFVRLESGQEVRTMKVVLMR